MNLRNHHKDLLKRLSYGARNHKSFTHGDMNSQLAIHYERYLTEMEQHGYVVSIESKGDVHWHITNTGRYALENYKPKIFNQKIAAGTTKGFYDGKELTKTCMRPGAYDYQKYPSRIGDKLVDFYGALA